MAKKIIITQKQFEAIINEGCKSSLKETLDSLIEVRHMKGSSIYKPKNYSTWKEYWKAKITNDNRFPTQDESCDCCRKITAPENFVGGHVVEVQNEDKIYIYPICNSCNSQYGKDKKDSPIFKVTKSKCVDFIMSEAIVENDEE